MTRFALLFVFEFQYKEAITICLNNNVQLTEELAEKLTPDKDAVDEATKIKILESLGESLMTQGSYHLATKKFTQAGNRVRFSIIDTIPILWGKNTFNMEKQSLQLFNQFLYALGYVSRGT